MFDNLINKHLHLMRLCLIESRYGSKNSDKYCKQHVGNKTKGRISKRMLQENKARQVFRKMNISYS